jgi:hypothetical protein
MIFVWLDFVTKKNQNEKYTHQNLPYKAALKSDNLRAELQSIFQLIIANAAAYLGGVDGNLHFPVPSMNRLEKTMGGTK